MANVIDTYKTLYAKDRKTWRAWLTKNHAKAPGIWFTYYKKGSNKPSVPYAEAVEEALCFGWIDATTRSLDEERYVQLFTPRKPKSGWSKINKERIKRMIDEGSMTPAGMEKIEEAKKNGTWNKFDTVDSLTMPPELTKALAKSKKAKKFIEETISPSSKKQVLYWITSAKLAETRTKRITIIIENAKEGRLPPQFAWPAKKN